MSKINIDDVPWTAWKSPKGKFSSNYKGLSEALGAQPNAPVGAGGHPFDLTLEKLAPGEISCPFHSHAAQWELFYILSRDWHRAAKGRDATRTRRRYHHASGW